MEIQQIVWPEKWIEPKALCRASACAETAEAFLRKMASRRSNRHFADESVDEAVLKTAIETAGQAPSGANQQPWFFALIQSPAMKAKIRVAAESVEREFYENKAPLAWREALKAFETNELKPYLTEAPALIAVFSRTTIENHSEPPRKTYYPLESTAISVGFLIAALHNAGLATLTHTPQPLFFLNDLLGFDRTFRPMVIVVTGYAKEGVRVPNIRRKELAEIMKVF